MTLKVLRTLLVSGVAVAAVSVAACHKNPDNAAADANASAADAASNAAAAGAAANTATGNSQ